MVTAGENTAEVEEEGEKNEQFKLDQTKQQQSFNNQHDAGLLTRATPCLNEERVVTAGSCDVVSTVDQVDELMSAQAKSPLLASAAMLTPESKQLLNARNSTIRSVKCEELGDTVKTLNLSEVAAAQEQFTLFGNQSPGAKTPQTAQLRELISVSPKRVFEIPLKTEFITVLKKGVLTEIIHHKGTNNKEEIKEEEIHSSSGTKSNYFLDGSIHEKTQP